MWLVTTVGFFSVVRKPGDNDLTVRSRVRADLVALHDQYLPSMGPIRSHEGTDYPYRATVEAVALGTAVARMMEDLDYPNFKDAVAARQGHERARVYGKVWSALYDLTTQEET